MREPPSFVPSPPADGDSVLDGGAAAGSWLSVTDLQPYTNYSFWTRGCNTQGCVESLPLGVTTPPAGTHMHMHTHHLLFLSAS